MRKIISLKYNKDIYSKHAIKEALSSYKKIAGVSFFEQKKYYRIEISEYQRESKEYIGDEFSNHVLSLM